MFFNKTTATPPATNAAEPSSPTRDHTVATVSGNAQTLTRQPSGLFGRLTRKKPEQRDSAQQPAHINESRNFAFKGRPTPKTVQSEDKLLTKEVGKLAKKANKSKSREGGESTRIILDEDQINKLRAQANLPPLQGEKEIQKDMTQRSHAIGKLDLDNTECTLSNIIAAFENSEKKAIADTKNVFESFKKLIEKKEDKIKEIKENTKKSIEYQEEIITKTEGLGELKEGEIELIPPKEVIEKAKKEIEEIKEISEKSIRKEEKEKEEIESSFVKFFLNPNEKNAHFPLEQLLVSVKILYDNLNESDKTQSGLDTINEIEKRSVALINEYRKTYFKDLKIPEITEINPFPSSETPKKLTETSSTETTITPSGDAKQEETPSELELEDLDYLPTSISDSEGEDVQDTAEINAAATSNTANSTKQAQESALAQQGQAATSTPSAPSSSEGELLQRGGGISSTATNALEQQETELSPEFAALTVAQKRAIIARQLNIEVDTSLTSAKRQSMSRQSSEASIVSQKSIAKQPRENDAATSPRQVVSDSSLSSNNSSSSTLAGTTPVWKRKTADTDATSLASSTSSLSSAATSISPKTTRNKTVTFDISGQDATNATSGLNQTRFTASSQVQTELKTASQSSQSNPPISAEMRKALNASWTAAWEELHHNLNPSNADRQVLEETMKDLHKIYRLTSPIPQKEYDLLGVSLSTSYEKIKSTLDSKEAAITEKIANLKNSELSDEGKAEEKRKLEAELDELIDATTTIYYDFLYPNEVRPKNLDLSASSGQSSAAQVSNSATTTATFRRQSTYGTQQERRANTATGLNVTQPVQSFASTVNPSSSKTSVRSTVAAQSTSKPKPAVAKKPAKFSAVGTASSTTSASTLRSTSPTNTRPTISDESSGSAIEPSSLTMSERRKLFGEATRAQGDPWGGKNLERN